MASEVTIAGEKIANEEFPFWRPGASNFLLGFQVLFWALRKRTAGSAIKGRQMPGVGQQMWFEILFPLKVFRLY